MEFALWKIYWPIISSALCLHLWGLASALSLPPIYFWGEQQGCRGIKYSRRAIGNQKLPLAVRAAFSLLFCFFGLPLSVRFFTLLDKRRNHALLYYCFRLTDTKRERRRWWWHGDRRTVNHMIVSLIFYGCQVRKRWAWVHMNEPMLKHDRCIWRRPIYLSCESDRA
jgi:hypothetical protein